MKQFILHNDHEKTVFIERVRAAEVNKPLRVTVEVYRKKRSVAQNDRMWAMLTDVSSQVDWYGQRLTPEEWKDVFTAALRRQKVVPGLDGGFVVIGAKTSRMTVQQMTDLIELMFAFGAEHGVKWSNEEQAA